MRITINEKMKKKKLYFLRHFKPNVDKTKPVAEWGLDEEGRKEMSELLKNDRFKNIDKIFTSPEPKAKITAKHIGEKYNIPVIECEYISEVDRSKAGFIEEDYIKLVELYFTKSDKFEYPWESLDHVKKRIKRFLEKLKKEEGKVLIISHGMLLSLLLSKYFNKDIIDFWKNLKFGDILKVDYRKLIYIWRD